MFIDTNVVAYFDSFGTKNIPQDALNKVKDQSIPCNISRIQDDDSIMCVLYYITFIEYMFEEKTLLGSYNLFSPSHY